MNPLDYHTLALQSETTTGALITTTPESQGEQALHVNATNTQTFSRHFFPASEVGFIPERLEVNGRKGRRVVCVLGRDRLHYKVFDLDGEEEGEEGEEGGEGEGGEEGGENDDGAMSP
jgi:anaphase-promoting complex subunit 4